MLGESGCETPSSSAVEEACARFSGALHDSLLAAMKATETGSLARTRAAASDAAQDEAAAGVPPDCTPVAEAACGPGSLVAPPTLNGWLLGYPVVYAFRPDSGCATR